MPRAHPAATAKNNPVHSPARELHTADLATAQPPDADLEDRSEVIVVAERQKLQDEYTDELAFMEEPITIRIEPSDEENAPRVVDCWVNGKGAEVMDPLTKKWMELSCIPIGGPVITKRKYVEVLARSRTDRVKTEEVGDAANNSDQFKVRRQTLRKSLFSVIHDPNPKGAEWLTRLYAER